ncbi:MAG: hypothetical protein JWP52_2808 [Rhizobacter sp.]|nr:hypothetical protein [Rhizobacter sp.]
MQAPAKTNSLESQVPVCDWTYDEVASKRQRYLTPALRTFTAFERPLLIKRGQGQFVWDADGRQYLDCVAQNLCVSVGYNHPAVNAAIAAQMADAQHVTTAYYHPQPAHFAEELVATLPAGVDWVVHFVNSGSEAVDVALLAARTFTRNFELLTLRNSYHGMHFGAMAATGLSLSHQPTPGAAGFVHVHNPDAYRGAYKDVPGNGVDPYVEDIRRVIDSSTPGVVAGMLVEPMLGYGGVIPMPPGYLSRAAEVVRAAGGVFMVDEIQTGVGRTGASLWAFEQHGVVPDVIVTSKGIGNGFPLAAVVMRRDMAESMAHRKFFNTYGSNPMACAAGRAVLATIEREGLRENAAAMGALLAPALASLQARHEWIGDVRGQGLLWGVEIVSDRHTREGGDVQAGQLQERLLEQGVIVGRSGQRRNVLRINPPLCFAREDVDQLVGALDVALSAVSRSR